MKEKEGSLKLERFSWNRKK